MGDIDGSTLGWVLGDVVGDEVPEFSGDREWDRFEVEINLGCELKGPGWVILLRIGDGGGEVGALLVYVEVQHTSQHGGLEPVQP